MPPDGLPELPLSETAATTRNGARRGLGCGAAALVVLSVVVLIVGRKLGADSRGFLWWVAGAGAVYLVCGIALRDTAKDEEGRRYERLRSPPLGTAVLPGDERTWIDGTLRSPRPVLAPEFGVPCVWMHVLVTKGTGRSKKTERDESIAAPAFVLDGTASAEVDLSTVRFDQVHTWTTEVDGRSVAVTFVRDGEPLSVCGRVTWGTFPSVDAELREIAGRGVAVPADTTDAAKLGPIARSRVDKDVDRSEPAPKRAGARYSSADAPSTGPSDSRPTRLRIASSSDAPVLVTPLGRNAWNAHAEAEEVEDRVAGTLILLIGSAVLGSAALAFFARLAGMPVVNAWSVWPLSASCGAFVVALPILWSFELRRLRRWRARGELAATELERELSLPDAVAERIAARVTVYEELAGTHDAALAQWPSSLVASVHGLKPFPPRG